MNASGRDWVDVVVCVHNSLSVVRPCLDSVSAYTRHPYRLVIVNDACDWKTTGFLQDFLKDFKGSSLLLENAQRLGFLKSCNRLLERNEAAFTLLLNSDTIVTPGWLERMVRCAMSDPSIGLVTALSNKAANLSIPMPPGINCFRMAELVATVSPQRYPDAATAHGFCLLLTQKVIAELGGFDPAYGEGYGEETDFHMRATAAGYRSVVADDTYVYHVGRASFGSARREEIFKVNRALFMSRWECAYRKQLQKFEREDPLRPIREALPAQGAIDITGTLLRAVRRGREYWSLYGVRGLPGKALGYFSRHGLERRQGLDSPATPKAGVPRDVLRVTYFLPTMEVYGGVISVCQLVNELVKQDVDARLAVLERRDTDAWHLPMLTEPLVYAQDRSFQKHLPDTDVLVATFWSTAETVQRYVRAHPATVPVYFLQDYEPWFYQETDPLRKKVAETFAGIPNRIVKSKWLAAKLSEHDCATQIIRLGLNLDVFYRREVERPPGLRVLAMARPGTPRRGFPELLRVLGRLKADCPAVEIILFGTFDEKDVHFAHTNFGFQSNPDAMAKLYSSADIYVDLSHFQGFGRPALESMACGTVPLCTNLGGLGEYARDRENCLLVPPQDEAQAYAALRVLVSDSELRKRLSAKGPESAAPFCHRREACETHAYFERLVATRRGGGS